MRRYTIMHVRLWHIILYILTISICVFTLLSLESQTLPAWLKLMLDVMSGVSFGLSIVLIIGDAGKVSGWLSEHLTNGSFLHRVVTSYRFRTVVFTYLGTIIASAYIVINLFYGIKDHFLWYFAMSVYYVIIGIMRGLILSRDRKAQKMEEETGTEYEKKSFLITGVILTLSTIVMAGIVTMTVRNNLAFLTARGILVYGIAIYTFYKLGMSVLNLHTASKQSSWSVKAIRNIGFVDALMSLLHLQITLITIYSSINDKDSRVLNIVIGFCICLICIVIGIRMIVRALKN